MTGTVVGPARLRRRADRSLPPAPLWLPVAIAAAGWLTWSSIMLAGRPAKPADPLGHLLGSSSMTLAMMGPLAIPLAATVRRSALWTAAGGAVASALGTYLGLWLAAGSALHLLADGLVAVTGTTPLAAVLALVCAADAASRGRYRRVDGCRLSRPLLPSAPRLDAARLGADAFRPCLTTCWAPMALSVVVPATAVPLSVLLIVERALLPRPRRLLVAAHLLLAGAVVLVPITREWASA